jgi:hypothetical protein
LNEKTKTGKKFSTVWAAAKTCPLVVRISSQSVKLPLKNTKKEIHKQAIRNFIFLENENDK